MADCYIVRRWGTGGGKNQDLLPNPFGLTHFFDYKNGVDVTNKTWTDMVSGTVCSADGEFNLTESYLEMNDKSFSLNYGSGISTYTIYAIVCETEYKYDWASFVADYGNSPQFNICNRYGTLAIGAGSADGVYNSSNVKSYGEWHVCCITLDEKFGIFYIDGVIKFSYNGYAIPKFTTEHPLFFGYGNIKMLAVCPNVAHSQKIIAENSQYLTSKYIT